jgi:hypothetical protein
MSIGTDGLISCRFRALSAPHLCVHVYFKGHWYGVY